LLLDMLLIDMMVSTKIVGVTAGNKVAQSGYACYPLYRPVAAQGEAFACKSA
jgi:hypothetical protein